MLKDATADYSDLEMQAAFEVNIPNYAGDTVTAEEIIAAWSSLASIEVADGSGHGLS
jgi:ureidoacrylate peracid hydrolase